jgi:hypothetical protein
MGNVKQKETKVISVIIVLLDMSSPTYKCCTFGVKHQSINNQYI